MSMTTSNATGIDRTESEVSPGWRFLDYGEPEFLDGARRQYAVMSGYLSVAYVDTEANARLIAAAPDLLEALKVAEDALREHACHLGTDVPCIRSPDQCASACGRSAGDALIAVLAAIAKASPSPGGDKGKQGVSVARIGGKAGE